MYCDLYSTEMETFRCKLCNIQFKSKRCLTAHKKSQRHIKHMTNENSFKHKCGCGKSYEHRQSLFHHRKSCMNSLRKEAEKKDEVKPAEPEKQKEHIKEVSELKEEIRLLKNKVQRRQCINKHVRKEVICKQNSQCNTCTKPLTEYNTNIDHKIGVQFGGTNDEDNLQALCVECHSEKTIKERRNHKRILNMIQQILSE